MGCGWISAHAATTTATPVTSVEIQHGLQILEDPGGELTLAEVSSENQRWEWVPDTGVDVGYSRSVWWFRFDIENRQSQAEWLLELAYPILDYVDLFVLHRGSVIDDWKVGDRRPFANRPKRHNYFLFPIRVPESEAVQVYLRIKTETSVQVPLTLWNPSAFQNHHDDSQLWHGLFYGGLLIIAAYNLLLYFGLRDRTYLYYVGYVTTLSLFLASLEGWLNVYAWQQPSNIANNAMLITLAACIFFSAWFVRAFLYSNYQVSSAYRVLHWTNVTLSIVFMVLALFVPYRSIVLWLLIFAVYACFFGMAVGVVATCQKRPSARYYLIAWSLLLGSGVVLTLGKMGVIEAGTLSDNAIRIGALLEVLLLSLALAERINRERALRTEAQNQVIAMQKQTNEVLEQRVKERTLELEQANQKLKELSDTDSLTGLRNRRYLNRYLEHEFARSARYRHPLSILMIDVDHFKSINDLYGHLAGDHCLEQLAALFKKVMRYPTDLPARYGGEEFCVVLPETDLSGAITLANRLIRMVEKTEILTDENTLSVTCSVGVFSETPSASGNINQFIDFADAALYKAKENGRNQVVIYSDMAA